MAAAAAIASSRKRKRPHYFETNPSIRKRQQTRLIRRLKVCTYFQLKNNPNNTFDLLPIQQTIDEFATRVGQQAIVLMATPGKPASNNFRVFGAKPLEDVVSIQCGPIDIIYTPTFCNNIFKLLDKEFVWNDNVGFGIGTSATRATTSARRS
jgi:hypothetical protein